MLPNIDSYELGAVLVHDNCEYIVIEKKGKKCIERCEDRWHEDTYVMCMGGEDIICFVRETIEEIEDCFPKLGLTAADKVELALTLWRQYNKEKKSC